MTSEMDKEECREFWAMDLKYGLQYVEKEVKRANIYIIKNQNKHCTHFSHAFFLRIYYLVAELKKKNQFHRFCPLVYSCTHIFRRRC